MADFTLGPGASESLKHFVSAFQAYGVKGPEGSALRKSGFKKADVNGSGMASLAEVENFINFALQEALEDEDEAADLFKLFRSSYITSFNLAKALGKSDGKVLSGAKTATADDYISFSEFRMFCVYTTICAAMYDVFTLVDGGTQGISEDDDSRISLDEFLGGWQALGGLGFMALQGIDSAEEATAIFKAVDTNDGGFILFKEWATYIKKKEIKSKTHLGTLLSGNLKATKIVSSKSSPATSTPRSKTRPVQKKVTPAGSVGSQARSRTSRSTGPTPVKTGMSLPAVVDGVYKPASTSKELKEFIKSIQPYTERTTDGKKLRKYGFGKCDMNGSGECSLAEVDGFVLTNLKADYGPKLGDKLFKTFRHAYIVAYNAAKDLKTSSDGTDDDYINFSEFRVLNVYLCIYAGMLDAFATVDGGGAGVSKDDDRRIGKKEWMKGYTHIKATGFLGLSQLHNDDDAAAAFQSMDADDNSGRILFDDFCNYLSAAEVDATTKLGGLFSGNGLRLRALNKSTPVDATPPPQDSPEEGDQEPEESQEDPEEAFEEPQEEEPQESSEEGPEEGSVREIENLEEQQEDAVDELVDELADELAEKAVLSDKEALENDIIERVAQ
jgi:hypothetical protein